MIKSDIDAKETEKVKKLGEVGGQVGQKRASGVRAAGSRYSVSAYSCFMTISILLLLSMPGFIKSLLSRAVIYVAILRYVIIRSIFLLTELFGSAGRCR